MHIFTTCICVVIVVIEYGYFCYPQIGNRPILNTFKNNFNKFLVSWACFENIVQYQKYVELRKKKKKDDEYDFKIFMVINVYKKHSYIFFFIHNSMSITIKPASRH
jgi:hypothetical protein